MTYQIITLNEREKSRTIWGTFSYSTNDPERVKGFLQYLMGSSRPESFLLHELETDRAFNLVEALPVLLEKLSKA